jgi:DNA-3-methyladenine glycosylase
MEPFNLPVDTVSIAKALLGVVLVHETADGLTSVRIVETEAYPVGDPASHAFRGVPTARTRSMYLRPGHAYVYRAYGTAWMLNVSSEDAGVGAGVLIRAGAPLTGLDIMQRRRGQAPPADLARGPGRLCRAMGIDLGCDGVDLLAGGHLRFEAGETPQTILATPRIGITKAADRLLRFIVPGEPSLSGTRRLNLSGLTV